MKVFHLKNPNWASIYTDQSIISFKVVFIDELFTIVKQSTLATTKKSKVTADVLDQKFTTKHYF